MDRRTNCYLNSAYNRNVDDLDDFIDNDSQLSFGSKGQLYDSENETYVDEFLDDRNSCYSEDNRLAGFNQSQIHNRSFGLQPIPRYRYDSSMLETPTKFEKSTDRLTSTPKKQPTTPSSLKNPHRREAIVRRRSFSAPSRRDNVNGFAESNYLTSTIRRSKSSLSLRQRYEDQRYAIKSTPTSPIRYQQNARNRSFRNFSQPALRLPLVTSVPPFHIRQKQADVLMMRNQFLRRPYDMNSSFSSTRPLVSRNTAVISPIYNKKSLVSSFEEDHSRAFTIAADRSPASSKSSSWLMQMKKPSIPLCTLRTSAITLLVSGTLSCLLSLHIMAVRGKSYELLLSLISGFVTLCLGFPCLRFQEWQWLPNRNYVSGYIVLSLFSLLQSTALWLLDKYPNMQVEILDITKGALWGLAGLSMSIALLGVCTSCCCKYPPPDNRVSHGVQGFTI